MALPVSQYSVLDAARIERLNENTFKCYVGSFKMFRMTVEPIVTVKVVTNEKGCVINLLDCEVTAIEGCAVLHFLRVSHSAPCYFGCVLKASQET